VADQLRTNGRVMRGRIGVQIAPVTKDVAESIGLGKPAGALVQAVEAGPGRRQGRHRGRRHHRQASMAARSRSSSDLPRIIGNIKPGTKTNAAGVPPRAARVSSASRSVEFEAESSGAAVRRSESQARRQ
jgi:serine protease Do